MAKLFISLLVVGTTSFSLYLTPAPISKKTPFLFLRYFLLIAAATMGLLMTLPFFFDWRLPLQQGLGSDQELLVRGLLIAAACLFAVVASRQQESALPLVGALALLAVGVPELLRVLDILNSTVNGMLNYGNASMSRMLRYFYPFLILFFTDTVLILLGLIILFSRIVRTLAAQ